MKANLSFPRNATRAMLSAAAVGDSIVFQGHRTSVTAPFSRDKIGFITNMAWVVLLGRTPPVPVTIVTVTSLPKE